MTEVDQWSDRFLAERILKHYPEHSIFSEEQGLINEGSPYKWIVDPLDGTTNYLHGFPLYSISIALEKEGETLLGAVYIPRLKEFFYAIKKQGAFVNDKKIQVAHHTKLSNCLMVTGFPYDKHLSSHNNINLCETLIPKGQDLRRSGSAALDLCYTACGKIDAYWEIKINKWDIAAGKLIVEEAGGMVLLSDIKKEDGEQALNIIAGNKKVVMLLKEEINAVYPYFTF